MDRKEQINNESTNYGYYVAGGSPERIYASRDFEQGALWADAHPISPWISVNSSKPSDYKELHRTFNGILIRDKPCTVNVIARAEKGDKVIFIMAYMYYDEDSYTWKWESLIKATGETYYITHWMPIPKLQEDKL